MFALLAIGGLALASLLLLVNAPSLLVLLGSLGVMITAVFMAENKKDNRLNPRGKAVLITGCDSGFGHGLTQHLDSIGVTVFAGCLNENGEGAEKLRSECSDRVHVLQLDVTKNEEILRAKEYMADKLPPTGLFGVVNNAAVNMTGEVELTTLNQYQKIIDINLIGIIRVTKAFLPLLRRSKGRIMNVSSVRGLLPTPNTGVYTMAKVAVEAMSDILRMEMKKWGVEVIVIEPGHYGCATKCYSPEQTKRDFDEMWESMDEETKEDYGQNYLDECLTMMNKGMSSSCLDMTPVVESMSDALLSLNPKPRYLIAGSNQRFDKFKLFIKILPYLPTRLTDKLILRYFASGAPTPQALKQKNKSS